MFPRVYLQQYIKKLVQLSWGKIYPNIKERQPYHNCGRGLLWKMLPSETHHHLANPDPSQGVLVETDKRLQWTIVDQRLLGDLG